MVEASVTLKLSLSEAKTLLNADDQGREGDGGVVVASLGQRQVSTLLCRSGPPFGLAVSQPVARLVNLVRQCSARRP